MGLAGEMVVLSIPVRYFRQAQPLVASQVFEVFLKESHHLLLTHEGSLKIHFRHEVVAVEPDPLWSVVVAEAVSDLRVT